VSVALTLCSMMRSQSPDNLEGPRGYVQLQSDQVLPDFIDANQNQLHPDLTHTVVTHLVRDLPFVGVWFPPGCNPPLSSIGQSP
jgi:hypothetical protein